MLQVMHGKLTGTTSYMGERPVQLRIACEQGYVFASESIVFVTLANLCKQLELPAMAGPLADQQHALIWPLHAQVLPPAAHTHVHLWCCYLTADKE